MKRSTLFSGTSLIVVSVLGATGCGRGADGTETAAGRPPVAVEVASVTTGDLVESIDVVGSLKPKREATIQSEFSGIVREVFVTEWVAVAKGQPLARLDSREAETTLEGARAALLQAEVNQTRAVREHERTVKLKAGGLATAQNVDDARSAREAAEAATAAARAQLSAAETYAEKMVTRSPLDGVVSFRGVNVGDRVENMGSGTPMFQIVDNRLLDLTVTVPSVDMAALEVGQPLTFTADAFPSRTFTGQVTYINPKVDEGSRSVKVVAEVVNSSGELRGGMFVKGTILTGSRTGVLLAPRAALLAWDVAAGKAELFVAEDGVAVRRQVRTGAVSGDRVEVVDGLGTGDSLITRGAYNLKDGDRIDIVASQAAAGASAS
jgi:membrane fusion protein (multidrug efflux system)